MRLLAGSDQKPEEEVEDEEVSLIEEIKDIQGKLEKVYRKENIILRALEGDEEDSDIDETVKNLEIIFQEDIDPEEEDIESKLSRLEEVIEEYWDNEDIELNKGHKDFLNFVEQRVIDGIREEVNRLEKIVSELQKIESPEYTVEKVQERLQDLEEGLRAESEEESHLEDLISRAVELENSIQKE